jgi:hypothetical protein
MGIAESGIGQEQFLLFFDPGYKAVRAFLQQDLS